ncbi:MAG: DUF2723 domain-containing protein [Chloroflexota bacterium]|nr:DUF2723 domain-containing protein [Chloroflexota bacterium]
MAAGVESTAANDAAAARFSLRLSSSTAIAVLAPIIAVALPVALYLRTLAPTVGANDSAEFATVGATFGVPHPPGYPLLTLLLRAAWYLPLGNPAFRANLVSAVAAAVALAFTYAIIVQLTHQRLPAVLGAWLLGLSLPFWFYAIVAEVYTLDAALFAGTILFLLRWRDTRSTSDLVAAFLCFGLSMANRNVNALNAPAIVVFLLPDLRREPRRVLAASLAVLPCLALYAILPLRSAMDAGYIWGSHYRVDATPLPPHLTRLDDFWWLVSAAIYRPLLHLYSWTQRLAEAKRLLRDLWGALMPPGIVLAVVGAGALAVKRTSAFALVALMVVPQTLFFINYAALDKRQMFINTYVGVAVFAGYGLAYVIEVLARDLHVPYRATATATACVVAVIAGLLIQSTYHDVDRSADTGAHERSVAFLDITTPNAIIIGGWGNVAPLVYVQTVEHRRPDVALVQNWRLTLEEERAMVAYNIALGRGVYTFYPDPLFDDYLQIPVGNWIKIEPVPH